MKQYSTRSTFLFLLSVAMLVFAFVSCASLPSETRISPAPEGAPTVAQNLVKLNSASSAELEQLPGVGKVLAERIVAHREKYGPFRRVEHLMMVRGISERKFRDLRPLIEAE